MINLTYSAKKRTLASKLLGTSWGRVASLLTMVLCAYLAAYGYLWSTRQQVSSVLAADITVVEAQDSQLDTQVQNAKIVFGGDVMLARKVGAAITASDFNPLANVGDYLRAADLTIVNLECVLGTAGSAATKPYTFHAPVKGAEVLKKAGIDLVSLANNHVADFGQAGFLEMLGILEQNELGYFGAGRNETDAYSPKIVDVQGIKVAILGFNDREIPYFAAVGNKPGQAWMLENKVKSQVAFARSQADYVVVMPHWGPEYTAINDANQVRFGRMMIDAGADLVVGGHTHHIQSTEEYKGKKIIYSIGNFVFDGPGPNAGWYLGNLVELDLTRKNGAVTGDLKLKPFKTDTNGLVNWL